MTGVVLLSLQLTASTNKVIVGCVTSTSIFILLCLTVFRLGTWQVLQFATILSMAIFVWSSVDQILLRFLNLQSSSCTNSSKSKFLQFTEKKYLHFFNHISKPFWSFVSRWPQHVSTWKYKCTIGSLNIQTHQKFLLWNYYIILFYHASKHCHTGVI